MSPSPDQALFRIFAALDDHRFDDLPDLYTESVQARTVMGDLTGRDSVVATARQFHEPFAVLQHLVTGVIIDEDGDEATVRANVISIFGNDAHELAFEGGSVWRGKLHRNADRWRVAEFSLEPVWSRGALPGT